MFAYNYNSKTSALYINLPLNMKFDYEFHNNICEMIYRCVYDQTIKVDTIFIRCPKESNYEKMCKAYLLNVLRYITKKKSVKWHVDLNNIIMNTVDQQIGERFQEININEEIGKNSLTYYVFQGDNDVQKPVNEMTNILVDKNLTFNADMVKEFLSTTIGEIFSNSINHSNQEKFFFMYDICYEEGSFYLCVNIIDYGTTIATNVRKYLEHKKFMKDTECLEWAIGEGNTTREGSGGYGLPTLISYIKDTDGDLYILSGFANYVLCSNLEIIEDSAGVFNGTSITFKVKLYNTERAIRYDKKKEKLVSISLDSI